MMRRHSLRILEGHRPSSKRDLLFLGASGGARVLLTGTEPRHRKCGARGKRKGRNQLLCNLWFVKTIEISGGAGPPAFSSAHTGRRPGAKGSRM